MWSHVVDKKETKQHALRFVDCDTMELWEILPEFADTAASYQQFVNAVYKLYPGSDAERRWSIEDMEKLVGEASRVGMLLLADLGKYHREFIAMTTFLIVKNCISTAEQSGAFTCGFPQKLWTKVAHRLQLKFPNHFPNDPYTLEQIHNTPQFVLHSTASLYLTLDDTHTPAPMMAFIAKAKHAELTTLIDMMKQAISKLGTPSALASQAKPLTLAPRDHRCHFCGGEHWKSSCEVLKEYVCDGKCILHDDGHITLPGGHFIPGSIAGKTFRECLNKWHQQNPVSTSTANAHLLDVSPNPTVGILQLSLEECILSLEKELFTLHACEPAPGVQTQAQKACDPRTDAPTPAKRPTPILAPAPVAPAWRPPPPPAALEEVDDNEEPLVHPFARAKDAAYAPLTTNNVTAKPKPAPLKKSDVPLRTATPVYDPQVASAVYVCTMDSQITITQHELLSLLPEVRNQVHEVTSNWHIIRTGTPLVETEYREILFQLETERSNKELYQIISQSRPVQMISY